MNKRLEQYEYWFNINYQHLLKLIGLRMTSELIIMMNYNTNKGAGEMDRIENEVFSQTKYLTAIVTTLCNFSQPSGLTESLSISHNENDLITAMFSIKKARKNPTKDLSSTLPE